MVDTITEISRLHEIIAQLEKRIRDLENNRELYETVVCDARVDSHANYGRGSLKGALAKYMSALEVGGLVKVAKVINKKGKTPPLSSVRVTINLLSWDFGVFSVRTVRGGFFITRNA